MEDRFIKASRDGRVESCYMAAAGPPEVAVEVAPRDAGRWAQEGALLAWLGLYFPKGVRLEVGLGVRLVGMGVQPGVT